MTVYLEIKTASYMFMNINNFIPINDNCHMFNICSPLT